MKSLAKFPPPGNKKHCQGICHGIFSLIPQNVPSYKGPEWSGIPDSIIELPSYGNIPTFIKSGRLLVSQGLSRAGQVTGISKETKMKNGIISALLAVCVIIPAAAYATGCFGPVMALATMGDANSSPIGEVHCPAGCCTGNLTGASPSGCCRISPTSHSPSGCCADCLTCTCPAGNGTVIQTSQNTWQSCCGKGPVDLQDCGRTNVQGGVSRSGCSPVYTKVPPEQVRGCCQ